MNGYKVTFKKTDMVDSAGRTRIEYTVLRFGKKDAKFYAYSYEIGDHQIMFHMDSDEPRIQYYWMF